LQRSFCDKKCFKGIVQRKLNWVEIVTMDRSCSSVGAMGILFLILKGNHQGFFKKRFAATWALIIGNVGKNW
jgi:hypothetical protein